MNKRLEISENYLKDLHSIKNKRILIDGKIIVICKIFYEEEKVVRKTLLGKKYDTTLYFIKSYEVQFFNNIEKAIYSGNGDLDWLNDTLIYFDLNKGRKKYLEFEEQFKAFNSLDVTKAES